MTPETHEHANV